MSQPAMKILQFNYWKFMCNEHYTNENIENNCSYNYRFQCHSGQELGIALHFCSYCMWIWKSAIVGIEVVHAYGNYYNSSLEYLNIVCQPSLNETNSILLHACMAYQCTKILVDNIIIHAKNSIITSDLFSHNYA
jgi:hypothetical protein